MKLLLPDRNLCEFLVANYRGFMDGTELVLEGYNQYVNLQRYSQRHPKRIFITKGEKRVKFHAIELFEPCPLLSETMVETQHGSISLDTIETNFLLVLDEKVNFELVYCVATLKTLGFSEKSLTLHEPSTNCIDSFYMTYGIKENSPLFTNIHAICQVIQLSLIFFGYLEIRYFDGILCESTELGMKTFIQSLHNDSNRETKIWSLQTIKILIAKVLNLRKRLAKLGFPVVKDPYAYPEQMHRSIKRFQKANGLASTKIADTATLQMLNKSNTKIKLTQHVAAVSGAVSNIKNKFGEIAGLKYDADSFGSDAESDSSPLAANNPASTDLNYYIRLIIKRDFEIQEKMDRKQKKLYKKSFRMSHRQATDNGDRHMINSEKRTHSIPARMINGIKSGTTKTLGGIASKGKYVTKGVKSSVKHLMHVGTSDSDSGHHNSDINLDDNGRNVKERGLVESPVEEYNINTESSEETDGLNADIAISLKKGLNQENLYRGRSQGFNKAPSEISYLSSEIPNTNHLHEIRGSSPEAYVSDESLVFKYHNRISPKQPESRPVTQTLTKAMQDLHLKMSHLDTLFESYNIYNKQLDARISQLTSAIEQRQQASADMEKDIIAVSTTQNKLKYGLDTLSDEAQKTHYSIGITQEKLQEFDEYVMSAVERNRKIDIKLGSWK